MKKYIFAFASASLLVACAPKVIIENQVTPVKVVETPANQSDLDLAEGKTLFYENCGKCHDLFQPSQYSKAQWSKIVPEMAKKAELNEEQGKKILLYVQYGAMN
jgi:cytochrome c5